MSDGQDKYAWHYKPWDMLRSQLDQIIKLLKEIKELLDNKNDQR